MVIKIKKKKMNLLNLMLIVLIITIDPFLRLVFNNTLVFIKPENLTKTELVEKFKELSSSKSLKDLKNSSIKNKDKDNDNKDDDKITIKDFLKSHYSKLSSFISKFKILITKIALFTILIKYFRKIKIMRIIFKFINYILLATFGIFISDIYGLKEIIGQIEYYWMEYFNFIHESKIYKTLVKIFHVVSDENKSTVIEDKSELVKDKSESKIIVSEIPSSGGELKNEKIMNDKTGGGNEKENWFQLNKYWIGLSILILPLIYIYWDTIIGSIKNVKPADNDGSTTTTNSPIFQSHEEAYKEYFKEKSVNEELYDLDVIKSQNSGKTIEYSDVENIKWEDSLTTPKASSSKLPETHGVMLPISKEK
jgi:hypothetical protein